jgi:hypothetical protein
MQQLSISGKWEVIERNRCDSRFLSIFREACLMVDEEVTVGAF